MTRKWRTVSLVYRAFSHETAVMLVYQIYHVGLHSFLM